MIPQFWYNKDFTERVIVFNEKDGMCSCIVKTKIKKMDIKDLNEEYFFEGFVVDINDPRLKIIKKRGENNDGESKE